MAGQTRAQIVAAMREMVTGPPAFNACPSIAGALWLLLRADVSEWPIDDDVLQFYAAAAVIAVAERLYPPTENVKHLAEETAKSRTEDTSITSVAAWLLNASLRRIREATGDRDYELGATGSLSSLQVGIAVDWVVLHGMAIQVAPGFAGALAGAVCAGIYAECRPYVEELIAGCVSALPPGALPRWDLSPYEVAILTRQAESAYVDAVGADFGPFRAPYLPPPDAPDATDTGPRGYACVVCHEPGALRLAEPCGHLAVCGRCAAAAPDAPCPICRGAVDSYRVIYESAVRAPAEAP